VDNLIDRVEFVHVSLRIPKKTKTDLEKQAKRHHTTFNSLSSKILFKGTSYDTIADQLSAVTINGSLFAGMLEDVPQAHLESMGRELGSRLIKQTFVFLDLQYDIEGLIQHYFEPVSTFSRWYSFTIAGSAPHRRLIFQHPHGAKWSAFLKAYICSIIKAATGVEPRATADDSLVTVYIG